MKRLELLRKTLLAGATIVAAVAATYALVYVVVPPVKDREDYPGMAKKVERDPARPLPPFKRKDIEAVWTGGPQPPPPPPPKVELVATLISTLRSQDPAKSSAIVEDANGQHALKPGQKLQNFQLKDVQATSASFACGNVEKTLTIRDRIPGNTGTK